MAKRFDMYSHVDKDVEKTGVYEINDVLRAMVYDPSRNMWVIAKPVRPSFIRRVQNIAKYLFDKNVRLVRFS